MKKIILSLFIFLFIFTVLTPNIQAQTKIVGGYLFKNLNLETTNQYLKNYNQELHSFSDDFENQFNNLSEDDYNSNVDYFNEIKNASGFFIAYDFDIDKYFDNITLLYKRLNTERDANCTISYSGSENPNIQLKRDINFNLNNINFVLKNNINQYLSFGTGIGYYWGEGENIYVESINNIIQEEKTENYNLLAEGTIGYSLGINFSYPIEKNLFFTSSLTYNNLNMKITIEDENNFQINNYDENLSGGSLKLGISAKM